VILRELKMERRLINRSMRDNAKVRTRLSRRNANLCLVIILSLAGALQAQTPNPSETLSHALGGTQASAVLLDIDSGAILAQVGPTRRGTPGSAIKPLLLAYAMDHGIVREDTQVYCRRDLHIGGRSLPCTHPADNPVFTAQRALAESCNTWFAEMGRRYSAPALEAALRESHLPHSDLSQASAEQRQLAVLGLQSITVSPRQLGQAYVQMLRRRHANDVVVRGLQDSVNFGMAAPAAVRGLTVLGKTGTASDPGQAWTHGWFVGTIPGQLLVVYVPHGDGGTAAQLAQRVFRELVVKRPTP
jgi:cell division protein FtsI/penicillin-binding protein 2